MALRHTLFLLLLLTASAQSALPLGNWQGTLEVNAQTQIELAIQIKLDDSGMHATLDVPAQGQFGLVFDTVLVTEQQVELGLIAAGITIKAQPLGDSLAGTYQQGSFSLPLVLEKSLQALQRERKPQEPHGDLPYAERLVSFNNAEGGHTLAGTLALPKGPLQHTLILLSGSGPTNRDGDAFGHKIYLVMADLLARQGIAVLRFDDRGVGQSGGDYASATSADFASDAAAAVAFIRQQPELTQTKVGFAGHSEGGLVAMMAATELCQVDFLVLLAAPGTSGEQILVDQSYYIQKKIGFAAAELAENDRFQRRLMRAVATDKNADALRAILAEKEADAAKQDAVLAQLTSAWFRYFVKTNPEHYLTRLQVPVLALNGALDAQVLAEPNMDAIKKAVNEQWLTTKIYSELNHLFQPASSGLPNEYGDIAITFSAEVANDISTWLHTL